MQTVIYIYGLVDPRDKRVRYVGKTNNLKLRMEQHVFNEEAGNPHKQRWIAGLKGDGLRPEMIVLEECEECNWIEREVYWIAEYRHSENDLINICDGGEGGDGNAWRLAGMRNLAKLQGLQIKKCLVCGGLTVSNMGVCTKCIKEIDEDYMNSDWYKFLEKERKAEHWQKKRDKNRIIRLNL